MEIGLPRGTYNEIKYAKVKRREVDVDGKPIVKSKPNPILDSRLYKVEFIDGNKETIAANVKAGNILAQVDIKGIRQLIKIYKDIYLISKIKQIPGR